MNPIHSKTTTLTLVGALVAQLAAPAAFARSEPMFEPGISEKVSYLVSPPKNSFLTGTDLPENQRAENEYAAKLQRLHQEGRAQEKRERRAARLAAFQTFRKAVRLQGPQGLRAFRNQAVSWGPQAGGSVTAEVRPTASNEWDRWYDNVEARARVNALEAVVAARNAGHAEAMQKARKIAREYRNQLPRATRLSWLQAFRKARGQGLKTADARRIADQEYARAQEIIEAKVAAKLAEAQEAELAKLEERALEAGYEAYAEEEEQAYATALEVMDEQYLDPDEGMPEDEAMSFQERQVWDQEQYEASQEQLRITRLQREGALLYGVPASYGAE